MFLFKKKQSKSSNKLERLEVKKRHEKTSGGCEMCKVSSDVVNQLKEGGNIKKNNN